jgi:hypothetical protein
MPALFELAKLIRSKNAGPFSLTFDIMFDDEAVYQRLVEKGTISTDFIAETYRVPKSSVQIIYHDEVHSIKVSIPRTVVSGSINDNDTYGCQQFRPIAELEVAD